MVVKRNCRASVFRRRQFGKRRGGEEWRAEPEVLSEPVPAAWGGLSTAPGVQMMDTVMVGGGRIPAQAEKTLAEVSSGGYECQEAVSCSGSGTEESRRQTIARSAAASPVPKSKRSAETNLAGTSPANPKRP